MKTPANILVINDSAQVLESLRTVLKEEFRTVHTLARAAGIKEMMKMLDYDLVLLDMDFSVGKSSGEKGIFWLQEIVAAYPGMQVILLTNYVDIDLAAKGIRAGASDFILKPWDTEKLVLTLKNAYHLRYADLELMRMRNREKQLSREINELFPFFPGTSDSMQEVMTNVNMAAGTNASILLQGEKGTGKNTLAREIHRRSGRADQIFMSMSMEADDETLLKSRLFGQHEDADTGGPDKQEGLLQLAGGGTLYLDEIGYTPVSIQPNLYQVIRDREISREYLRKSIPTDVRIITSSSRPLNELVRKGEFHEDLLERINTVTIELPPLRDREGEVFTMASFFLKVYGRKYGKEELKLEHKARIKLSEYRWPGNISELKAVIECAVIRCKGAELGPADLKLSEGQNLAQVSIESFRLEEVERETILRALKKVKGNHSHAAQLLDISRTTLYAKLKKYGILRFS